MNWLDVVFLVLIAGYCAYVIFAKKKGGCSGCCDSCCGCACKKKDRKGISNETQDRRL